jgi:RNA polymerase sigma-70 factor (ECF subfamily)
MPPPTDQARWFAEEVQPHEAALRSYLRHRFPAMHDVDDIVQDSYVQLLQRQPRGRIASVRAYLFTVAHHAVLRVFRRRQLWSDVPLAELPPERLAAAEPDAASTAQERQREALVAEAVARLPRRCREIFELRLGSGLSHGAIAERLGLSEATVRVQLARGVQKCVRFLRERRESEAA